MPKCSQSNTVYGELFLHEVCDFALRVSYSPDCAICHQVQLYDKRKPVFFKLEHEGDGIIRHCSKTYHCFGKYDKASSRGLNKPQNNLKKDKFLSVLQKEQSEGGKYISFRILNSRVYC